MLLILLGRRERDDIWHEFGFCVTANSIDVIINFHLVIFLFSFVSSLMWMMMSNNPLNYINFIWENIPFSWHFYFYKKGWKGDSWLQLLSYACVENFSKECCHDDFTSGKLKMFQNEDFWVVELKISLCACVNCHCKNLLNLMIPGARMRVPNLNCT